MRAHADGSAPLADRGHHRLRDHLLRMAVLRHPHRGPQTEDQQPRHENRKGELSVFGILKSLNTGPSK